jgi:peptide/nickel transport system permease protein
MIAYLVKRLIWAVVMMLLLSFITFLLFFVAPADVPLGYQGSRGTTNIATQFQYTRQPLPVAFVHFVWGVVRHGDLGQSFSDGQPVTSKLERAVPVTFSLVLGGTILWMVVAFVIGVLSALRPRSLLDRTGMVFVLIGISIHPIALGLTLAYLFGVKLHLTPIAGYCNLHGSEPIGCGGSVQWAYHLLLPWMTFAFLFAALYARMIRASVLETLQEDYVRTATAKGASRARVLRGHVLRNALLPVVTMLGMDIGLAFAGSLFIEEVFNLPGVGQTMAQALSRRDMPVIMGVVLVVCVAVVMANTVIDILYRVIDPRVLAPAWRPQRRVRVRSAAATKPTPPRSGGATGRRRPSPAVPRP